MAGVFLIVATLLVGIPVAVMVSGAVAAAILSMVLKKDVDAAFEGSELLALETPSEA